ncbi:amidase [Actinomycetota bacterium Odt1-20B]
MGQESAAEGAPGAQGIAAMDALAQAAAVRAKEISPVELVEHGLDRIAAHNEALGAFVTLTEESARAAAKAAEQRLATEDPADLPPLFGVPTAVKDLTATAGVRTMHGSAAFAENVPQHDAHSVRLLKAAGTISLGKTNTPEFGVASYTASDVAPVARTPWDTRLSAGGSSGGAAAAVAAGIVPFAHGSDGGGSLRIPASVCGIVGFKPSRGRVSSAPEPNVAGLAVEGPLARTVRDAAALLDVLSVPSPGDPYWAQPLPPGETFLAHAQREPGRLRIARYADLGESGQAVDPDCRAAYEDATALLTGLGHEVEEIPNPFVGAIGSIFFPLWGVQSLRYEVPEEKEHLLRPLTRFWRRQGRKVSGEQLFRALAAAQTLTRRVIEATSPYDAVLTPTLGLPPQPLSFFEGPEGRETEPTDDQLVAELHRQSLFTPFTSPLNITGQPAVSLPLYWNAAGLPIGVSLTGRPAGEGPLLSLCAQVEAARPWAGRWPEL